MPRPPLIRARALSDIMKDTTLKMSPAERTACAILVVERDPADANHMREALRSLGYTSLSDAPSHHIALEKISGRHRFQTDGGDAASGRERRIISLASPCQMQLNEPLPKEIGSPA